MRRYVGVGALIPFLFVDGLLFFALLMIFQLDWIVNNTLYSYNLTFSLNWAVPYWTFLRIILVLVILAIVSVSFLGFNSYRMAKRMSRMTVYVCRSCGNVWASVLGWVGSVGEGVKLGFLRVVLRATKTL